MKTLHFKMLMLSMIVTNLLSAQAGMLFKLQLIPATQKTWGVYATPMDDTYPSTGTFIGSGQVTLVAPNDFIIENTLDVNGKWQNNATVVSPSENPGKTYYSFGYISATGPITFQHGEETLLFKIVSTSYYYTNCPESLYLIDNQSDPFAQMPNSLNTNPGNEISVFDYLSGQLIEYAGNYAPFAWDCGDNDEDGILNAFEDTNGNGQYDPGVDATNLNVHEPGINFKLQLMPNGEQWGIYAKPDDVIFPSANTITGSAQITVVMPKDFNWTGLQSVNGNWGIGSYPVIGPLENPNRQYVFFNGSGNIPFQNGQETLLFTFKSTNDTCPDSIYLMSNKHDPFSLPNSLNINAGQEITVIQWGTSPQTYYYHQNYAPSAWNCHDSDGDGTVNAFEDTNGNGVYDPCVDVSNLYDASNSVVSHTIEQQPSTATVCAGSEADFHIQISGGIASYQWQVQKPGETTWTDLADLTVYGGTHSGTLHISNSTGLDGYSYRCLAFQGSCLSVESAAAKLNLLGEPKFISQPAKSSLCTYEAAFFAALAEGSNNLNYQWQLSSDGINFTNIAGAGNNGFAGVNSPNLSVQNTAGLNGYLFRLAANGGCSTSYSQPAWLNLQNCNEHCVLLKLGLLPGGDGWGVYTKPFGAFVPTENAVTTEGRITLALPTDFLLDGFSPIAGNWLPSNVATSPLSPNLKFVTFDLILPASGQESAIKYSLEQETLLFQFKNTGSCPETMFILENAAPNIPNNILKGTDDFGSFEYCGVFDRQAWRCNLSKSMTRNGGSFVPLSNNDGTFTAYPNPAGDNVNIVLTNPLAEGRNSLALWDLQGRRQMEILLEGTTVQLDLSGLPAGVYFVSLAQNGRVVERQELVKK